MESTSTYRPKTLEELHRIKQDEDDKKLNIQREGFWYPDKMPIKNSIDPLIKDYFLQKFEFVEKTIHKDIFEKNQTFPTTKYYAGFSKCRICGQANGSEEYDTGKWIWPSGYIHYIREHNVNPSKGFYEYIIKFSDFLKENKI